MGAFHLLRLLLVIQLHSIRICHHHRLLQSQRRQLHQRLRLLRPRLQLCPLPYLQLYRRKQKARVMSKSMMMIKLKKLINQIKKRPKPKSLMRCLQALLLVMLSPRPSQRKILMRVKRPTSNWLPQSKST